MVLLMSVKFKEAERGMVGELQVSQLFSDANVRFSQDTRAGWWDSIIRMIWWRK